jgi:hypothetical protein
LAAVSAVTVSGASAIQQRKGFMKLLDKLDEDDVLIGVTCRVVPNCTLTRLSQLDLGFGNFATAGCRLGQE